MGEDRNGGVGLQEAAGFSWAQYATAKALNLPHGIPQDDWEDIGVTLREIEVSILWWLGDWWLYGEREYGESSSQAAPTGYSLQTVKNAAWVASRFVDSPADSDNRPARRDSLSFAHHAEVAGLEPARQNELLDQAEQEGLTRDDLRQAVKRIRSDDKLGLLRTRAADLAAFGKFPVVLADPPWRYEHAEETRAIENNYPTMDLDTIKEIKIPAADDAVLFCWATSPKLAESMEVLDAWGFEYRTNLVWVKDRIGMGYYARQRHELLLVAKRGDLPVPAPELRPDSVITAPRGEHSVKPERAYEIIEAAYPGLPKVELFARGAREGWVAWGDQA